MQIYKGLIIIKVKICHKKISKSPLLIKKSSFINCFIQLVLINTIKMFEKFCIVLLIIKYNIMEFNLTLGIKGFREQIVSFDDTAAKYGSGLVEVFATPAMIALMENTCYKSVNEFLPNGFGTVGTKVDVSHIKSTAIGEKVYCKSELIEIDRKRLVFIVNAYDEDGEIGSGKHERFIIDLKKFMLK